jgi:hypothetical protein
MRQKFGVRRSKLRLALRSSVFNGAYLGATTAQGQSDSVEAL